MWRRKFEAVTPGAEPRPTVILLDGVGSVGKSSTARAIQTLAREPMLHVAMDGFLEMLPARMFGHPDGYIFEALQSDGQPAIAIHSGPVMERLLDGMRHAVAALAQQGNSLIVDDVMFSGGEAQAYRDLVSPHADLHLVGLHAPLAVLEQRERDRGDREIGLARWQFDRVHQEMAYDLEIDTSQNTPSEVAAEICRAFEIATLDEVVAGGGIEPPTCGL